jgi:hypothetical protein
LSTSSIGSYFWKILNFDWAVMEDKNPDKSTDIRETRSMNHSLYLPLELQNDRFLKSNVGIRPHRCEPRWEDFGAGIVKTKSPMESIRLFGLIWKCMKSKPGSEPTDPYLYVETKFWDYWDEMKSNGNIRNGLFEPARINKPPKE